MELENLRPTGGTTVTFEHKILYAEHAIEQVFSDTTVTQNKTRDALIKLRDDIVERLDTLKGDGNG